MGSRMPGLRAVHAGHRGERGVRYQYRAVPALMRMRVSSGSVRCRRAAVTGSERLQAPGAPRRPRIQRREGRTPRSRPRLTPVAPALSCRCEWSRTYAPRGTTSGRCGLCEVGCLERVEVCTRVLSGECVAFELVEVDGVLDGLCCRGVAACDLVYVGEIS